MEEIVSDMTILDGIFIWYTRESVYHVSDNSYLVYPAYTLLLLNVFQLNPDPSAI